MAKSSKALRGVTRETKRGTAEVHRGGGGDADVPPCLVYPRKSLPSPRNESPRPEEYVSKVHDPEDSKDGV